ncbi:MAG TPA: hypothetical protein VI408_15280 [Gaiellaceae bacterium]
MSPSAASGGPLQDERPRLGELLVALGALSQEQLVSALRRQQETNIPLGRLLVEEGYVRPATVAMALADQHGGLLRTEYGFATGHGKTPPVERIDAAAQEAPVPEAPPELRLVEEPEPTAAPVASPPDETPQLHARIGELEAERDAARRALDELKAEVASRGAALAAAIGQERELRAAAEERVRRLEAELAQAAEAGTSGGEHAVELDRLRADLATLTTGMAQERDLRAAAEERVRELEAQIAESPDAEQLTAAIAQERDLRAAADERVRALEAELAGAQAAAPATEALAEVEELRTDLATLQSELASERNARAVSESRAQQLLSAIDSLKRELAAAGDARAAAEQALAEQGERDRAAERRARELEDRLTTATQELAAERATRAVAEDALQPRRYDEASHVLFFRTPDGYAFADRTGAAPAVGETVELDGCRYEVARVAPAPVPGAQLCAYLDPLDR